MAIDEEFLDLGSTFSDTNVSNFIEKTHLRNFATLNTKEKSENHINLEEYPNEIEKKFKVVLLMNVLEHIKNINNCFKNINYLLEKKGTLYGSTPFIYHIHESPNDYFRFTKQFLNEFLIENDFTNVEIKTLGTGIFCNMYSSLFNHTKRIPLLNVLLFPTVIIIDKFISIFFKNLKNINPLGYFFVAKKN